MVKVSKTGCLLIGIDTHFDQRGSFSEVYRFDNFHKIHGEVYGKPAPIFVQDNTSFSCRNVVRGMHYQVGNPQGKFVRVLQGTVLDVVIDIKKGSPTYGMVEVFELNSQTNALYVPPTHAHGFVSMSDKVYFLYKCTDFYSKENERCINPLSQRLDLPFKTMQNLILSPKDVGGAEWGEHEDL